MTDPTATPTALLDTTEDDLDRPAPWELTPPAVSEKKNEYDGDRLKVQQITEEIGKIRDLMDSTAGILLAYPEYLSLLGICLSLEAFRLRLSQRITPAITLS